jgi:hypothetical protein
MNAYTGQVPATRRAPHWLTFAACRADDVHPDEMFPDSNAVLIEHAKSVCRRCPVQLTCLDDALRTGDTKYGIRGAKKPEERRKLADAAARRAPDRDRTPPAKTLTEAFLRRITRTTDGHITWSGAERLKFQGVKYTAMQAAFIVGHGREPEGQVRRTCEHVCFRWDHLTDAVIRDEQTDCGTPAGYRRHKRHKEPVCGPCKQAQYEADLRYRQTGTTKVAA